MVDRYTRRHATAAFRERGKRYKPAIPEGQVIALWLQHALPGRALPTRGGGRAVVVSAGRRNERDGPDFTGAVIVLDGVERRGAIEVHVHEADWRRHDHDGDARYGDVILHVVLFEDGSSGPAIPTVVLSQILTQSLRTSWMRALAGAAGEAVPACREAAFHVPPAQRDAMLRIAAEERFECKVSRVLRRWDELGGGIAAREQLLFEMLMRALGYGGNEEAFQDLARRCPLAGLMHHCPDDALGRYAMLARAAGAWDELMASLPAGMAEDCARRIGGGVPAGLSQGPFLTYRSRPWNSPLQRLRWMACFLPSLRSREWWEELLERSAEASARGRSGRALLKGLLALDMPLHSAPVLGNDRADEIIVNIFAPLLSAHARRTTKRQLMTDSYNLYFELFPAPRNSITVRMAAIFGLSLPLMSWQQQGLLQLKKEYCARFRCNDCLIGHSIFH